MLERSLASTESDLRERERETRRAASERRGNNLKSFKNSDLISKDLDRHMFATFARQQLGRR
jgi:hypothetical protein